MSETRKSHLSIDGAQAKEDDHVASYKQIPDADSELRASKPSLSKSKEKVTDEAEEKLLAKEEEAKIVTRVDMADAKYVVGDHRNGDAKIELDANKRQFSGLTKEELLKYADDPFWVRLRWAMFVLFWALWLCMLGGAIAIIVGAPKCAAPLPKTWYEVGPLADLSSELADFTQLESDLPILEQASVKGVFVNPCEDSYEPLEDVTPGTGCLDKFRAFAKAAKEKSIKVIVDLTANFVSTSHAWFKLSENKSAEYDSFFVWGASTEFDGDRPKPPNNWISTLDESAWSWSETRGAYYLHQFSSDRPDLNMNNPSVVAKVDQIIAKFMSAGAAGIRLQKARQLVVNPLLPDETADPTAREATHLEYASLLHRETSDRPQLDALLAHWAHRTAINHTEPTVFTIAEDGRLSVEWHLLRKNATLRPPSLAPIRVEAASDMAAVAESINKKLKGWPALQLESPEGSGEVSTLAMLLPAAPVLTRQQIFTPDLNDTSSMLSSLATLRLDASIQHGQHAVTAVPAAGNQTEPVPLIACARWKAGHTGLVAVYNAGPASVLGDLTVLPGLPQELALHQVSERVATATNYTINMAVKSNNVLVPAHSAVLLSYVPSAVAEE